MYYCEQSPPPPPPPPFVARTRFAEITLTTTAKTTKNAVEKVQPKGIILFQILSIGVFLHINQIHPRSAAAHTKHALRLLLLLLLLLCVCATHAMKKCCWPTHTQSHKQDHISHEQDAPTHMLLPRS